MIRPLYPIPIATRPPRPPARRLELDVQLPQPSRDPDSLTLGELLSPLRRRWGLIALLTLCGLVAALYLARRQQPVYEATALLEVSGITQEVSSANTSVPLVTDRAVESNLQTQVRILESPELWRRVADKLDLWNRPEFQRRNRWWSAGLTRPGGRSTREEVLRQLSNSLVARVSGQTSIIEVEAESPNPELASELANTASRELIELSLARRARSAAETKRWLSVQLQEAKNNLERSEQALQAYANENGLLYLAETNSVDEAALRQLQEALSRARQDRVVEQGRYERAMTGTPDALPEMLDDGTLAGYQTKLTDLNRQLAELSATLKPAHFRIKETQAQIKTLQAASERRLANILKRIKTQYDSALARERQETIAYEKQISRVTAQAGKAVRYGLLKREVDTNRQVYELMLQKAKDASIASAARATNIQLFNAADIPQVPSKPILILYAAIGLASGLLAGSVLAFGMSRRREGIRVPEDLTKSLGLPDLGVIPTVRQRLGVRSYFRRLLGVSANGAEDWENRIELASCPPGDTPPSDSIRAIVASILYSNADGPPPQVIAVTSVSSGEGKTTIAANIAAILAQTNQRVLLVDGHFRRPRLHKIFNLRNDGGLIQALNDFSTPGSGSLNVVNTQPTTLRGLFVLPAGSVSESQMNRLYSQSLTETFAALRHQFDAIVIDTSPLSDLESRPLARVADGVLLTVRAGRTTVEDLREAAQRLFQDGSVVLGTVMNRCDLKKPHPAGLPG